MSAGVDTDKNDTDKNYKAGAPAVKCAQRCADLPACRAITFWRSLSPLAGRWSGWPPRA